LKPQSLLGGGDRTTARSHGEILEDGVDDSASELAGEVRLFGRGIDVGCYECQHGAGSMLIMR